MSFRERTRRANAGARFHLLAALGIAASLAVIVAAQTLALGWRDPRQIGGLVALLSGAALPCTFAGSWLADWIAPAETRRVAVWMLLVGGGTMGLGALIYALIYRAGYAQWHDPIFTRGWLVQAVFTMAGAFYYWAVLAVRLIMPWAIVPLALGALAFARRSR